MRHLPMIESTCCLMNPLTSRINNALDIMILTTALKKVSNCNHRSKHSVIPSFASPGLKTLNTVVTKNPSEALYISFDGAILPSCSTSTSVSSNCNLTSIWVSSAQKQPTSFGVQDPDYAFSDCHHDSGIVSLVLPLVFQWCYLHRVFGSIIR